VCVLGFISAKLIYCRLERGKLFLKNTSYSVIYRMSKLVYSALGYTYHIFKINYLQYSVDHWPCSFIADSSLSAVDGANQRYRYYTVDSLILLWTYLINTKVTTQHAGIINCFLVFH
jgi:hypothetical protein